MANILVVASETIGGAPLIDAIKRRLWEDPPPDGGPMSHFAECVVSGTANPMGIAIDVRREGDEAVADFNLGAAFEGAPKRAHGGIVAHVQHFAGHHVTLGDRLGVDDRRLARDGNGLFDRADLQFAVHLRVERALEDDPLAANGREIQSKRRAAGSGA